MICLLTLKKQFTVKCLKGKLKMKCYYFNCRFFPDDPRNLVGKTKLKMVDISFGELNESCFDSVEFEII